MNHLAHFFLVLVAVSFGFAWGYWYAPAPNWTMDGVHLEGFEVGVCIGDGCLSRDGIGIVFPEKHGFKYYSGRLKNVRIMPLGDIKDAINECRLRGAGGTLYLPYGLTTIDAGDL